MNETKPWVAPELRFNENIFNKIKAETDDWYCRRIAVLEWQRDDARRWARKFQGLSKGYAILADDLMAENAELRRRIAELEGQLEGWRYHDPA